MLQVITYQSTLSVIFTIQNCNSQKQKLLRLKCIAAVLLGLLLFNSFFYCLYCNICIWQREAEVKAQLTNQSFGGSITLIKMPVNSVDKATATEGEIWYHKNLYDVVKRQLLHDTLYIYMVADEEEETLVNKIDAYISAGDAKAYSDGYTVYSQKNTLKMVSQHYISNPEHQYVNSNKQRRFCSYVQHHAYYITAEIITPPPKQC